VPSIFLLVISVQEVRVHGAGFREVALVIRTPGFQSGF